MSIRPIAFSALRTVASVTPLRFASPAANIFRRTLYQTSTPPSREMRQMYLNLPVHASNMAEAMVKAISSNRPEELRGLVKQNHQLALRYGHDLIVLAANWHRWDVLEVLIHAGISVETYDSYGNPPLHQFDHVNDIEPVRGLLEVGADINSLDKWDRTLLNKVLADFSYSPLLIELGASVLKGINAPIDARFYSDKQTLLHQFAMEGNAAEALRISLTQAGAQAANWINTADARTKKPLTLALEFSHCDHASHFLEHGAEPSQYDKDLAKGLGLSEPMKGVKLQGPGWKKR